MASAMKLIVFATLVMAVYVVEGQLHIPRRPQYQSVLRCPEKLDRVYGPADNDHGIITAASFALRLRPETETTTFDIHNPFTWPAGTSRLSLSVESATATDVDIHLSTKTCREAAPESLATSHKTGEPLEYETTLKAGVNDNMTFEWDEIVDYENIASVSVLLEGGSLAGCCDLEPFLPEFPEVWTTTMEGNFLNRGWGFHHTEYFDGPNNRLRVDVSVYDESFIRIERFHPGQTPSVTFITPANETDPVYCFQVPPEIATDTSRFETGDNNQLMSTARIVGIDPSKIEYIRPGDASNRPTIRGMPTEVWREQVAVDDSDSDGWTTVGEVTVEYHFLTAFFMHPQDSYHRPLLHVTINGSGVTTPPNQQPVAHPIVQEYSFIGFRPGIDNSISFDTCDIAPEGVGCCPPQLDSLTGGQSGSGSSGGSGDRYVIPSSDSGDDCGSGYDSSQSGLYAAFSILGLMLGAGAGALVAWLLMRRSAPMKGLSIRAGMAMSDNPAAAAAASEAKASNMEMSSSAPGAGL